MTRLTDRVRNEGGMLHRARNTARLAESLRFDPSQVEEASELWSIRWLRPGFSPAVCFHAPQPADSPFLTFERSQDREEEGVPNGRGGQQVDR